MQKNDKNKAKREVEDEDNTMMSIDGITQRAAFVPLLFLANTIIGLFLLMISGSIILYQMIFLVISAFCASSFAYGISSKMATHSV